MKKQIKTAIVHFCAVVQIVCCLAIFAVFESLTALAILTALAGAAAIIGNITHIKLVKKFDRVHVYSGLAGAMLLLISFGAFALK